MDLLILQFNTGQFTEAQAKQVLSICFDVSWPMLKQKFIQEGDFFYNERLREEIDKRKNFTESRRNNGLMPKSMKTKKEAYAKHMPKHMEDENENENININRVKKFLPPTLEQVKSYFKENEYSEDSAIRAFNYYEVGGWRDSKGNKVKNWKQKMQAVWFKDENREKKSRMEEIKSW